MKIAIIDCGTSVLKEIGSILSTLGCSCETFKLETVKKNQLLEKNALVITGGPQLLTDAIPPYFISQVRLFLGLKTPILGICLGHQLLGISHKANVFRGKERREMEEIKIIADHPFVKGLKNVELFKEDHCEGIELPIGFSILGSSRYYPVEIMASDEHLLFGVQFHPELSGDAGRKIFENFIEIIKIA